MWASINGGIPKAGWVIVENPSTWMIWGYPYFRKPPYISIDHRTILFYIY